MKKKIDFTPDTSSKIKFVPDVQQTPSTIENIGEIAKDMGVSALQGATLNLADEAVGLVSPSAAQSMREAYATAQERSPILSPVSEIGGAIVSPVSKIFPGVSGPIRAAAEGVVSGIGAANEDKFKPEGLIRAGVSGAAGAGMSMVGNIAKGMLPRSADTARAKVTGAGSRAFSEIGVKNRENIAKELAESGFYSSRKVSYDPVNMKFAPSSQSKFTLDEMQSPVPERLLSRAQEGINSIQEAKKVFLDSNRVVPTSKIESALDMAIEDYAKKNPRYFKAVDQASALKQDLIDTLKAKSIETGQPIGVKDLDELKSSLYQYTSYGKEADALPDSDLLYQNMARNLKDLVNDSVKDPAFKKMNEFQSKLLTVSGDLSSKIASLKGTGAKAPGRIDPYRLFERSLFESIGGDAAALQGAAIREAVDKVPFMLRATGAEAVQQAPGVIIRQQLNKEDEIPTPGPQASIPRRLQNLPMELIKTPLPRTTEGLLKNKNFVLAKIAQEAPSMFGAIKDVMENQPDKLPALASMAAQQVPQLFEQDKYNSFDGVIMDPKMKIMAMDDVRGNDSLSSIEKAKMFKKIQKNQRIS